MTSRGPSNGAGSTLDMRAAAYAKSLMSGTDRAGNRRKTIDYLRAHAIDKDIAARYQLGYVSEPLIREDELFRGWLVIPYMTTRAGNVAIKFRCTLAHDHSFHGGKYGAPVEQEGRIFNSPAYFKANGTIGIAEGELDAIVASELIGLPTVGLPGARMWSSEVKNKIWRLTFEDYDRILVFADGDDEGLDCARAVQGDLGRRARLVKWDKGE